MRVLGLAVAGIFAITVPVAGHADAPKLNLRPADQGATSKILLVAEGGRSGGQSGAIGGHTAAGQVQQWNGGHHRGPNGRPFGWGPYPWQGVPTYWSGFRGVRSSITRSPTGEARRAGGVIRSGMGLEAGSAGGASGRDQTNGF